MWWNRSNPELLFPDYYRLMADVTCKKPKIERIRWQASGGTDVSGEWSSNGNFSLEIRPGEVGNSFSYNCSLYSKFTGRGSWKRQYYTLYVGVKFDTFSSECILRVKVTNRKKALQQVLETIEGYEKTNQYWEKIWPKIWHREARKKHIFKEQRDGSLTWVCTTVDDTYNVTDGRHLGERPLGTGVFWVCQLNEDYRWDGDSLVLSSRSFKWERRNVTGSSIGTSYPGCPIGGGSAITQIQGFVGKDLLAVS
jgi:hypothetical protein